jgi:hypothetical protein
MAKAQEALHTALAATRADKTTHKMAQLWQLGLDAGVVEGDRPTDILTKAGLVDHLQAALEASLARAGDPHAGDRPEPKAKPKRKPKPKPQPTHVAPELPPVPKAVPVPPTPQPLMEWWLYQIGSHAPASTACAYAGTAEEARAVFERRTSKGIPDGVELSIRRH